MAFISNFPGGGGKKLELADNIQYGRPRLQILGDNPPITLYKGNGTCSVMLSNDIAGQSNLIHVDCDQTLLSYTVEPDKITFTARKFIDQAATIRFYIYAGADRAYCEEYLTIIISTQKTLAALPLGSLVKSSGSKYNGHPVVFIVGKSPARSAVIDGESIGLVARDVLSFKEFDAIENGNPSATQPNSGFNRYSLSNIDQWLNSSAGPGKWYHKTHWYDNPPSPAYSTDSSMGDRVFNTYDQEAGFLYDFEPVFINKMLPEPIMLFMYNTEERRDQYERVERKVRLLTTTETAAPSPVVEGQKWEVFNANSHPELLLANATDSAIAMNNHPLVSAGKARYWLATAYQSNGGFEQIFNSKNNTVAQGYCNSASYGVRPVIFLSSMTKVSSAPDVDGVYEIIWED